MMRKTQDWIKQLFGAPAPPTANQTRHNRAETVRGLQQEVRKLQQDITDLGNDPDIEREGNARQLASLYRDLEQKQAELARYQARI